MRGKKGGRRGGEGEGRENERREEKERDLGIRQIRERRYGAISRLMRTSRRRGREKKVRLRESLVIPYFLVSILVPLRHSCGEGEHPAHAQRLLRLLRTFLPESEDWLSAVVKSAPPLSHAGKRTRKDWFSIIAGVTCASASGHVSLHVLMPSAARRNVILFIFL